MYTHTEYYLVCVHVRADMYIHAIQYASNCSTGSSDTSVYFLIRTLYSVNVHVHNSVYLLHELSLDTSFFLVPPHITLPHTLVQWHCYASSKWQTQRCPPLAKSLVQRSLLQHVCVYTRFKTLHYKTSWLSWNATWTHIHVVNTHVKSLKVHVSGWMCSAKHKPSSNMHTCTYIVFCSS